MEDSEPETCSLLFRIADVGSGARAEVLNLEYLNLKPATFVRDSSSSRVEVLNLEYLNLKPATFYSGSLMLALVQGWGC